MVFKSKQFLDMSTTNFFDLILLTFIKKNYHLLDPTYLLFMIKKFRRRGGGTGVLGGEGRGGGGVGGARGGVAVGVGGAPAVEHILTILVSFDLVTVHSFLSVTV